MSFTQDSTHWLLNIDFISKILKMTLKTLFMPIMQFLKVKITTITIRVFHVFTKIQ